jgi:poly-beta-1,6-N-acetyl-D-glucosamine synthase
MAEVIGSKLQAVAGLPAASLSYVLITPARNEAAFIAEVIESVVQQTVRPLKWVIVSDGSTDGMDEIVQRYASQHEWIELVRMPDGGKRNFAGKVHAFNAGYDRVKELDYDIIGNLDADITFDPSYFAFLVKKFIDDPELGVAGTPYREGTKTYDYRFTSIEHVSGACQLFRRKCFQDIGGYTPIRSGGIDLVAVLSARDNGWKTCTFVEKTCEHHRKVGSAAHTGFRERIHRGRMDYLLGSHPVWELCRSVFQMKNPPYLIGGVLIMWGYVWTMLSVRAKTMPPHLVKFRRREQMRQLQRIVRRRFTKGAV